MAAPRTKNGCLDFNAMIEPGENEHGATNVHVNGITRNDDLKGPQDWPWGQPGRRDGKRFGPFYEEPDFGTPIGIVAPGTPGKRKRK